MHGTIDIDRAHVSQVHATGKPYIVSISGLTLADNMAMLDRIYQTPGIAGVELNLACPNIPGKPMIAYDFDQMHLTLSTVCKHPQHGKIPLGVKLAPYFDATHFDRVIDILTQFPIRFIVCINTIGNGLTIDAANECEGMAAKSGLGGLGGGFCKHTALANVRQMYKLLQQRGRTDIDIIGVGGVKSGLDAFELILCGAKAVQVGTCHWTEGSTCFDRIAKELCNIITEKGYTSIEDFRGKLKPYTKQVRKTSTNQAEDKDSSSNATTSNRHVSDTPHTILLSVIAILVAIIFYLIQQQKMQ
jgi:dihydroorotate dehydrogenase (fumarate)